MPAKSSPRQASSNLFLFAGNDESAIKESAAAFVAQHLPSWGGDFGSEIVDGAAENVDQAVERINGVTAAIDSLPMFADRKLVWLKNCNAFSDTVLGRSEHVLGALARLAELCGSGIPDYCLLVISAIDPDKRRTAFKELSKLAEVNLFDRIDETRPGWEDAAEARLRGELQARNIQVDGETLLLLVLRVGANSRLMDGEIEKLDLYLGDRRVLERRDVELMVPISKGAVVFELGNAIAEGDAERAYELVDVLFGQKESAIGILLASIVPTIRNLLLARDLMERHNLPKRPGHPSAFTRAVEQLPSEALAHLPRKKDGELSLYPLGIAARHAGRFSVSRLLAALRECVKVNTQLVTSQTDPRIVIEALIASLTAPEAQAS